MEQSQQQGVAAKRGREDGNTEDQELVSGKRTCGDSLTLTETPAAAQSTKRVAGVISWDDYFMSVAFLSAMRSKDPSTQVGACIVNPDKRIVGIGYNFLIDSICPPAVCFHPFRTDTAH